MKTLTTICMTSLLLGTLAASSVLAHPAPYSHYHPAPAKKKVVYRTTPAPPTTVIIVEEKTIVRPRVRVVAPTVTVETAPAPTVVVRRATPRVHRPWHSGLSIGVHGTGVYLDGDSTSTEGLSMGGAGATLRTRLSPHLGLELKLDVMGGKTDAYSQTTVPIFASGTYHFWPSSSFQPYVLAGIGAEFSRKEFLEGRYAFERVDVGLQVGAGAELFITDSISINADLRAKLMGNVSTETQIRTDCINTNGTMTGFCDNIQSATPGDDFQVGIQASVGANIYF